MTETVTAPATVVLVNGLWMPWWMLRPLTRCLRACGFAVRNFRYPSVRRDLAGNVRDLNAWLGRLEAGSVHLVGYSLGGIVIQRLFSDFPQQRPGRILTLGAPHNGSHAATALWRHGWTHPLLGRSIADLAAGVPVPALAAGREWGSIAGSLRLGLGMLVPGAPRPGDGTVAVAETRMPGITDHITLPVSHFGLLLAPGVARQACEFLRRGRFAR